MVGRSVPFGTTAHFQMSGGSFRWKWVAGCQPRNATPWRGPNGTPPREGPERFPNQPYLWTSSGKAEPIDEFVRQSPNGRYAAYIESGHLIVFDAKLNERLDLTLAGAAQPGENSEGWARTSIDFSFGNVVAFLHEQNGLTQLVALQLDSRESFVLHETQAQIEEFWFDAEGHNLIVTQSTRDTKGHALSSNRSLRRTMLGRRYCPSPGSAHPDERRVEDGKDVIRIPIKDLNDREEREEEITETPRGCISDHRYSIAHSSLGGWLVGFPEEVETDNSFHGLGPVQWVTTISPPDYDNCKKRSSRLAPFQSRKQPIAGGGFNAVAGLWHFDVRELNQALQAQGYSSTGVSHVAYGGELFLSSGRYRGTLGIFGVNSKNVGLFNEPAEISVIYGIALGLSAGYSALRTGRLTLMPEIGAKVLALEVEFSKGAPSLPLPISPELPNRVQLESAAFLLDAALRLEVRVLDLGGNFDHSTYLTLGNYLGWEQQLTGAGWRVIDDSSKGVEGSTSQPRVNRSGPLGLLYLGVSLERY